MANIKSQIKRIKTNEKSRQRNKAGRATLKTQIAAFQAAAGANDKKAAKEALDSTTKKLDQAVTKGFIHKKNAANKKSSLTKVYNQVK